MFGAQPFEFEPVYVYPCLIFALHSNFQDILISKLQIQITLAMSFNIQIVFKLL